MGHYYLKAKGHWSICLVNQVNQVKFNTLINNQPKDSVKKKKNFTENDNIIQAKY